MAFHILRVVMHALPGLAYIYNYLTGLTWCNFQAAVKD